MRQGIVVKQDESVRRDIKCQMLARLYNANKGRHFQFPKDLKSRIKLQNSSIEENFNYRYKVRWITTGKSLDTRARQWKALCCPYPECRESSRCSQTLFCSVINKPTKSCIALSPRIVLSCTKNSIHFQPGSNYRSRKLIRSRSR